MDDAVGVAEGGTDTIEVAVPPDRAADRGFRVTRQPRAIGAPATRHGALKVVPRLA